MRDTRHTILRGTLFGDRAGFRLVSEGIMDKRKVIAAYRGGLISVQECAQILGVDNAGWIGLIRESGDAAGRRTARRPVRS